MKTIYAEKGEVNGDIGHGITVVMTEADAKELRHQMAAFWQNRSVGCTLLVSGDSPFAQIYNELGKALGEK
jgi:hypothetical protein